MSTVQEIEAAITELPHSDFWELAEWFDQARDEAWARKMQADADAGRLDFLFDEAAAARAEGEYRKWPEQA